jgi:hypothetical protein
MTRLTVDQVGTDFGRTGSVLPVVLLSGLLLGHPWPVAAQTWNGSVNNLWGTAGNWTPNTVPNSNTASAVINVGTNNPVLINISPTVANLEIASTFSASLNNGQSLTIAGGTGAGSLNIAGTLALGAAGLDTDLILGGTNGSVITLSGGGTLSLSLDTNNRIYSTTGDTLVNTAGNTIQGSGRLGLGAGGNSFTLNNAGIINDNQNIGGLVINPGNGTTNTGTLEASNGGGLILAGTFSNTNGTILSTGSGSLVVVGQGEAAAVTINGGTLTTTGGGLIAMDNGTLNGVTISTGSTVNLFTNNSATLEGTITNNGTIAQNSMGLNTDLHISGAVTLSGDGALMMSNNGANRVFG